MSALKNPKTNNVIEKIFKEIGRRFFAEGANALADKIGSTSSSLLRKGTSEGGKLMSEIKKARKLKK